MLLPRATLLAAVLSTSLGCGATEPPTPPAPPVPPAPHEAPPVPPAPHEAPPVPPAPHEAPPVPPAPPEAPPGPAEPAPSPVRAAEPAAALSALERVYVGAHRLGVNRVTDQARPGRVHVVKRDDGLWLEGRVERGPYFLALYGKLTPVSAERFELEGTLSGIPDMRWAGEAPTARETRGRFGFEVKKGRSFWRMYRVNNRDCVCDDGCGNDFCYVDVERALSGE